MKRPNWIIAAYIYCAMHIVSWRILLSGPGHEPWERPFQWFFGLFFLPLNILAGGMCRSVWGSFNIFEARYVVGIVADVAIASSLCVTIVVACAVAWRRRRVHRGSVSTGETHGW